MTRWGGGWVRATQATQRVEARSKLVGLGALSRRQSPARYGTRPRCTARCRDGHACQAGQLGHPSPDGYQFTGFCAVHGKESA